MTDEERAEEYLEPIHRMYSCNNENYTDEVIIQAYLDGLAEGRKENNENVKRIQEFRKIDQKQILDQMDKIAELEKQIKKMKCCGNCNNNAYCDKEHYGNDKGCEDWELADGTQSN